jgi:hypothetical protein
LYDGFKKLIINIAITIGCVNKKLSAGDRMRRGLEFQIRRSQDDDEKLFELRKTLKNGQTNENLYSLRLTNVESFVLNQDLQRWIISCTTQDFQLS